MFRREFREEMRENLPRKCSKTAQFIFLFFFFVGVWELNKILAHFPRLDGHFLCAGSSMLTLAILFFFFFFST